MHHVTLRFAWSVFFLLCSAAHASEPTPFTLSTMPPSFDGSAWYFGGLLPPALVILALAIFGLRNALGGRELI